jgi:hypothetical protein
VTERIACLIVPFRAIDTDDVVGIHRIRLDRANLWPKAERRMLGRVHKAAVKLGKANGEVIVGEGVETAMAAQKLGYSPAWALGSVGMIAKFPVLDGCKRVTILAEKGEASAQAIKVCAARWRAANRAVRVLRSEVGDDLNDLVMGKVG